MCVCVCVFIFLCHSIPFDGARNAFFESVPLQRLVTGEGQSHDSTHHNFEEKGEPIRTRTYAYDGEQDDPFYAAGSHRNLR